MRYIKLVISWQVPLMIKRYSRRIKLRFQQILAAAGYVKRIRLVKIHGGHLEHLVPEISERELPGSKNDSF